MKLAHNKQIDTPERQSGLIASLKSSEKVSKLLNVVIINN